MPYKNRTKQLAAQRAHYDDNKKAYDFRQNERRARARDYVRSIKERSSCLKCGNNNPIVLEFHHRVSADKEIMATRMVANKYSNARIDKELAKCDVLCANCHRVVHHELGYLDLT